MINDIEKAGIMNHELGFKTYHRMLINGGLAKSTFVGDWWLQSSTIRKSKVMINCYVISFYSLFLEGIWTFILKIYCCLQSASEWCQFYQRQKKRKLLVLQKLRSAPHTIREHIFAVQLKGKIFLFTSLRLVWDASKRKWPY